jgi:rRNA-processing protein FCF1
MKVILEYILPEESFLLQCAEQAVNNRMLLESIKTTLEAHEKHSIVPEVVVQEIKAQMRGFK